MRSSALSNLPHVTWVHADLDDTALLDSALQGTTRLFLLTGNDARLADTQTGVIRAAERAGVKHVVKLSALGASDHSNSRIARDHWAAEQALRATSLAWTMLRPHAFMQNWLQDEVRESIRGEGVIYAPIGDGRVPFIDTRDIAEVAAKVLLDPEGHAGRKYVLTGCEAVGYGKVAAALSAATGRSIVYRPISLEEARAPWLRAAWTPRRSNRSWPLRRIRRRAAPRQRSGRRVERLLGRPPPHHRRFRARSRGALPLNAWRRQRPAIEPLIPPRQVGDVSPARRPRAEPGTPVAFLVGDEASLAMKLAIPKAAAYPAESIPLQLCEVSMNGRCRLFVVSVITAGACAEGPVAPVSDAPDVVMSANLHAQDTRRVKIMDTCDTETFDAVLGAGSCVIDRGTTFDQFIHQLTQQQTVQSWRNNPQFTRETVGTTLEIRNDGGETHTFTRVAQFGGGFIDDLNQLSGNPVPAPECLNFATIGFVPSGGTETQVLPASGANHYMCCIHPWMRTTIVGR